MSSGQGGLLRAPSVAHSFELGAEALCGRVRFGEGPVEKCLGCPRVGLLAAQEVPEGNIRGCTHGYTPVQIAGMVDPVAFCP